MRLYKYTYILIVSAMLTGCSSSVKVNDNLVTLNRNAYFNGPLAKTGAEHNNIYKNLLIAYEEIGNKGKGGNEILSPSMAKNPLIVKMITAAYEFSVPRVSSKIKPRDISTKNIEEFTTLLRSHYGAGLTKDAEDSDVQEIIKYYLLAYYSDDKGFIDREGAVYKRPEIKNKIGNDVITTVVAIFLEALFDGTLKVPVFYTNPKEITSTAYRFIKDDKELEAKGKIVEIGKEGIDKYELKAIRYLSGLAADQSKILSGAAVRLFGDLELGFVIGGHFSFGDNDTFAKIMDTIFEISSKRLAEAAAYELFYDLTLKYDVNIKGEYSISNKDITQTTKELLLEIISLDPPTSGAGKSQTKSIPQDPIQPSLCQTLGRGSANPISPDGM
ncbi:MAG: hypothetical protein JXA82_10780 [Sedimentisphaerales bacterium]|nr:hypothetical protein [Sedimentisphaerales bacterium]